MATVYWSVLGRILFLMVSLWFQGCHSILDVDLTR